MVIQVIAWGRDQRGNYSKVGRQVSVCCYSIQVVEFEGSSSGEEEIYGDIWRMREREKELRMIFSFRFDVWVESGVVY